LVHRTVAKIDEEEPSLLKVGKKVLSRTNLAPIFAFKCFLRVSEQESAV